MNIITGTPLWVWPLLLGLLWIGFRATKPRSTRPALLMALPLLGILALRSVASLAQSPVIWAIFAAAYLLGGLIGYQLQAGWISERHNKSLKLRGEWITLATLLTLFCGNFALGALRATAPDMLLHFPFAAALTLLFGLAAGSFAGRALQVWHYWRS